MKLCVSQLFHLNGKRTVLAYIEKRGVSGVWENAADQLWRFASGDVNLIEIAPPEDEAPDPIKKDGKP